MTFELNIGENNITKELETEKIIEITKEFYDGATFILGVNGLWKGQVEKSMIVQVKSSKKTLKKYMKRLKEELKQEKIAYKKIEDITLF